MNCQEIFDRVVTHQRAQGRRAVENGACVLRTKDGLCCAVGCLIPEDRWPTGPVLLGLLDALSTIEIDDRPARDVLHHLRWIHDNRVVEQWEDEWTKLAHKFSLTVPQ